MAAGRLFSSLTVIGALAAEILLSGAFGLGCYWAVRWARRRLGEEWSRIGAGQELDKRVFRRVGYGMVFRASLAILPVVILFMVTGIYKD